MFKNFIKKNISFKIRALIRKIYYNFFNRVNLQSYNEYISTDEKNKYIHILEAINYSKVAKLDPVYYEFGCYSGRTASAAIRTYKFLKIDNFQVYFFDSFQGLPETYDKEDGVFQTGTFSSSKKQFIKAVYDYSKYKIKAQSIIEGFYDKSLIDVKYQNLLKPSVIHIDVDLYSSTKLVLDYIKPFLQKGCIILFDDWYCFNAGEVLGEKKAFIEFQKANKNFTFEAWKNYSTFGKSFFVTGI